MKSSSISRLSKTEIAKAMDAEGFDFDDGERVSVGINSYRRPDLASTKKSTKSLVSPRSTI